MTPFLSTKGRRMKQVLFVLAMLAAQVSAAATNISILDQQIDQVSEMNAFNEWQGKSGSSTVCQGVVLRGSYLFMEAKEDGLDYAQTSAVSGQFPDGINADVTLIEPITQWDSGFQIGLGYIFPQRQQWDLCLDWTYFHSKAKGSVTVNAATLDDLMIRPNWLPFLMGTLASDALAKWNFVFNTLDLCLGREFFTGRWITVHPKIGIRASSLNQHYSSFYTSFSAFGSSFVSIGEPSYIAKWDFKAMGLRLGTSLEWHLNSDFSILANLFGSLLYGRFDLHESFDGAFVVATPAPLVIPETITVKKRYFRVRPVLEGDFGARWQRFFKDKTRRASIGAYYALSYWFQQNAMFNQFLNLDLQTGNAFITNLPLLGDLQMQGLRIAFEFDF